MIIMARNIAVADDVYEQLKMLKRKEESFSELLRRLLRVRRQISNLAGSATLTVEQWAQMHEIREKQAMQDESRRKRIIERAEGR